MRGKSDNGSPGDGPWLNLSRREREIMEAIYRRERASAAEVLADLSEPPSYSAVRALLRILEQKGYLNHEEVQGKYIYSPKVPVERAKKHALRSLLDTFFNGSTESVVAALLEMDRTKMTQEELKRLSAMIEKSRKEGR